MNLNKSLSIIIPNYNGAKLIPLFMPSVIQSVKHYPGEAEIIVIDDGSSDESLNELIKFPEIKLLKQPVNCGFSKTCNTGIHAAKHDILLFLNSDVWLEKDFLNYFSSYFDLDSTFAVGVLGYHYSNGQLIDGAVIFEWTRGMFRGTKNYFPEDFKSKSIQPPFPAYGVRGAYFFASKSKVMELEGFDELFSPYIFEETELCYRALKRGWRIYFEPRAIAYHQTSSTIKSMNTKFRIKTISTRNRLFLIWKNIHSPAFLISHFFHLLMKLMTLNPSFICGIFKALPYLPKILQKRVKEKRHCTKTDRDIFNEYLEYFRKG